MSTIPPTEYIAAEDLQPGHRIIYGSLIVEVAAWPVAASWREGGEPMTGVEIACTDVSGTGKLFLYRARDHLFERITDGSDEDPCPMAKVPCSANAFDMCRYCGRDLGGNPDA